MLKIITLLLTLLPFSAGASIGAIQAEQAKKNRYSSDAIASGGDALANPVSLMGIRWAQNSGFERIVVDLSGEGAGWEAKLPPYFQVGVNGEQKKISINIRGIARRQANQAALAKSLSRSPLIAQAYLAPAIEGDLASIELSLRQKAEAEIFYLVSPPRIIIDVRAKP